MVCSNLFSGLPNKDVEFPWMTTLVEHFLNFLSFDNGRTSVVDLSGNLAVVGIFTLDSKYRYYASSLTFSSYIYSPCVILHVDINCHIA